MVIQKLRAKNQTYSGRWMFTTSRTTDAIVWQPETIILQAARLKILYGTMAPIYSISGNTLSIDSTILQRDGRAA
jgi:hypothetical protein